MALLKTHIDERGCQGNYWNLSFKLDGISKEVLIEMKCFVSLQHRLEKRSPMSTRYISAPVAAIPALVVPTTTLAGASAACYAYVKLNDSFFEGSQDV